MSRQKQIVIKKYQNRRLYNTATSSYITLDELANLIKRGDDVVVFDAKTNEDLTRLTLTQIILEHESHGYNMLPIEFLRQIVRLYDDSMSNSFRAYLIYMLEIYTKNQDSIRKFTNSFEGNMPPFTDNLMERMSELQQQNQEFFQNWWQAWTGPSKQDKK
ncbi:MAG: polyhydroxyalkanoate synthesis repressor PhaR [Proteobacteria bacterium]|nr:polyhydroxyalkanoate synthesis repressor PhaR [Pseudomonadota bacterium]